MPTFRVPIRWRVRVPDPIFPADPIRRVLTAAVDVSVQDQFGNPWPLERCIIDTGCSTTMISATLARSLGVEFPSATSRLRIVTANGTVDSVVHDGELRLAFVACPGSVFRFFCLFVEEYSPAAPVLLGLNDLLDVFRVTFDGAWSPGAEMGHIALETRN
jgi:hypothetical protein